MLPSESIGRRQITSCKTCPFQILSVKNLSTHFNFKEQLLGWRCLSFVTEKICKIQKWEKSMKNQLVIEYSEAEYAF
jgi:hypothetical protein